MLRSPLHSYQSLSSSQSPGHTDSSAEPCEFEGHLDVWFQNSIRLPDETQSKRKRGDDPADEEHTALKLRRTSLHKSFRSPAHRSLRPDLRSLPMRPVVEAPLATPEPPSACASIKHRAWVSVQGGRVHVSATSEGPMALSLAECAIVDASRRLVGDPYTVALGQRYPNGAAQGVWLLAADGDAARDKLLVALRAQQRAADPLSGFSTAWARRRPLVHEASPEDFDFLCVLGRGSFGCVLKARDKLTQRVFACKVVRKQLLATECRVKSLLRERVLLGSLSHPNVSKLHAAFQTKSRLFLLFDFLSGGDLFHHLVSSSRDDPDTPPHMSVHRALFYTAELALALDYLHSRGIIHRDVKAENLVLDGDGHCMLTDFGFATALPSDGALLTARVGTEQYMAPEIAALPAEGAVQPGEGYGAAVDWFAAGVVGFLMMTGCYPFSNADGGVEHFDLTPEAMPQSPALPEPVVTLLCGMLRLEQSSRLATFSALRSAECFRGTNWESLEARAEAPPFRPRNDGSDVKYFPGAQEGDAAEAAAEAGLGGTEWDSFITRGSPAYMGLDTFSDLDAASVAAGLSSSSL
eukprot:TRINITY_DN32009_c0_g1_i1.p1 TRINITY_DN32009_c0_g1~~TRINITY_DN32009_c0_g1_i1.p1  ORF type:complete len:580 (+),score=77.52 TRINITY_DN32009_c0_g1_i1:73-1812(+)